MKNKKNKIESKEGPSSTGSDYYPAVPESGTWKTDYAWISGVAGALTVLILGYIFNRTNLLNTGFSIGEFAVFDSALDGKLFALIVVAIVMVAVELIRLWLRERKDFFSFHPSLKAKQYSDFFVECFLNYLMYLALLAMVLVFFRSAGVRRGFVF